MNTKFTSNTPWDRSEITIGIRKWILVNLVVLLALGASLFLAAGRIDWGPGWVYLGVILAGQTATTLILVPTNPRLLEERSWMQKGSKSWDQMIVGLIDAVWLLTAIVAGLNARFGWSPRLPLGLLVAGWVVLVLGYLVFLWAMVSNRFFSSFVRIQTNRGHTVESGGPYRYVRHPGYAGDILIFIATPLALASLAAFLPASLIIGLFVYRTILEDRTLQIELSTYADYARRVRYRLLPGVW